MKKNLKTTAAAALALALAGGAAAQPAGPHGGRGMARIMDALDLTEAQRPKVQALLEDQRASVRGLHEAMAADRQELRNALEAAQPDATVVGKAMLKVKADREAMKARREALRASLKKVLTPEQNAKLDGFFAGMRAGRGGFRGGMGRGPGADMPRR